MKKNCNKTLTIRHIINSLNDIMTKSSGITLDSEVIISDINFQEYGDVVLFPIKDLYYGEDKLRIRIKLKETPENFEENNKIIKKEVLGIEEAQGEETQEPVQKRNWWEKYK